MTSELKNPGLGAPTDLNFDTWPRLGEFFAFGGVPGVEYLYLCPEEMPNAQSKGWSTVVRMPFFKVNGIDLTAMAKGEPIVGAARGSSVCRLNVSHLAQERTGLTVKVIDTSIDPTDNLNNVIAKSKANKPTSPLEKLVS